MEEGPGPKIDMTAQPRRYTTKLSKSSVKSHIHQAVIKHTRTRLKEDTPTDALN
jgi:hypothetical protein